MTVFALSWGTTALGYSRQQFLLIQLFGILFFAVTIPLSARAGRSFGRRRTLLSSPRRSGCSASCCRRCCWRGTAGAVIMIAVGLSLMGLTYGPLGTALSELFPTAVRYTGSSLTFNLAGVFGASLAPYIATWLAKTYGLPYVGLLPDARRRSDLRRPARVAGNEGTGPRELTRFYRVLRGSTGFYRFYRVLRGWRVREPCEPAEPCRTEPAEPCGTEPGRTP